MGLTTDSGKYFVQSIRSAQVYGLQSNYAGFAAVFGRCSDENWMYVGGQLNSKASFVIVDSIADVKYSYLFTTNVSPTIETYISKMESYMESGVWEDTVFGTILIDPTSTSSCQVLLFSTVVDTFFGGLSDLKVLKFSKQFMYALHIRVISTSQVGLTVIDTNYVPYYLTVSMGGSVTAKTATLFGSGSYTPTGGHYSTTYGPLIAGYTNTFAASTVVPAGYTFSK